LSSPRRAAFATAVALLSAVVPVTLAGAASGTSRTASGGAVRSATTKPGRAVTTATAPAAKAKTPSKPTAPLSPYCVMVKAVSARFAGTMAGGFDPVVIGRELRGATGEIKKAKAIAPANLRADITIVGAFLDDVARDFSKADPNDPAALGAALNKLLDPVTAAPFEKALARIDTETMRLCGHGFSTF
jgi:hypothetical protein